MLAIAKHHRQWHIAIQAPRRNQSIEPTVKFGIRVRINTTLPDKNVEIFEQLHWLNGSRISMKLCLTVGTVTGTNPQSQKKRKEKRKSNGRKAVRETGVTFPVGCIFGHL